MFSYITLQGVWGCITVLISLLYIGLLERVNINNTRLGYYIASYITGRPNVLYTKNGWVTQ